MKIKLIVFGFLLMSLILLFGIIDSYIWKPLLVKDLNKLQKAQVYFKSFDVSLIKDFPNVSLKLSHVALVRPENYLDTLASIHSVALVLPISSIWDSNKKATKVELNHPIFWFDSTKNWKVFQNKKLAFHFIDDHTKIDWNFPCFISSNNKTLTYFYPSMKSIFINSEVLEQGNCIVRKKRMKDRTFLMSWYFSKEKGTLLMNDSCRELEKSGIKRIEYYEQ